MNSIDSIDLIDLIDSMEALAIHACVRVYARVRVRLGACVRACACACVCVCACLHKKFYICKEKTVFFLFRILRRFKRTLEPSRYPSIKNLRSGRKWIFGLHKFFNIFFYWLKMDRFKFVFCLRYCILQALNI